MLQKFLKTILAQTLAAILLFGGGTNTLVSTVISVFILRNTKLVFTFAALGFITLAAQPLAAATIFTADTVTTTASHESPATLGYTAALLDQSLTNNYVSGVTDFDSFFASTNASGGLTTYGSFGVPFPIDLDFGFTNALSLDRIAIWNQTGSASLNGFELLASASGIFDDLVSLGTFSIGNGAKGVFNFAETDILGLRLSATSNYGYANGIRLREIAFGGQLSIVPLPAALPFFAVGLGVLGLLGWRRKRTAAAAV